MTGQTPIFHITEPGQWQQASERGSYDISTRGASLTEVGYVHCSFAHQVATVANHLYADWVDHLLLLEIDVQQVGSPIRVENLDGGTEEFPHVYGPIPVVAVSRVHSLLRTGGHWQLPDLPDAPDAPDQPQ